MFVIVQAWNNLPPDFVKNRGVPEAIGVALQHAVSSIPGRFSNKYILACFGTYTAFSIFYFWQCQHSLSHNQSDGYPLTST